MWGVDHKEGWVLKNWCLQTVELEKTLESPLDSKEIQPINPKGNQSWILNLKLQYFGHLMWRADSLEKTLMLGKTKGRRGQQKLGWLDGTTNWMDVRFSKLQKIVKDRKAWHSAVHGVTKNDSVTEQQWPMSWSVPGILHLKSLYFVLARVDISDTFQGRRGEVSQRRYFIPFVTELYFIICT